METLIINALTSLFGALFGAVSAYILTSSIESSKIKNEKDSSRLNISFDFHREYNSPEFGRFRRISAKLIKSGCDSRGEVIKNIKELEKQNPNEIIYLFTVMRFFQRLFLADKYGLIDKRLVNDMFREPFYFWYYNYLKDGLTDEWSKLKNDLNEFSSTFLKVISSQNSTIKKEEDLEHKNMYTNTRNKFIDAINIESTNSDVLNTDVY